MNFRTDRRRLLNTYPLQLRAPRGIGSRRRARVLLAQPDSNRHHRCLVSSRKVPTSKRRGVVTHDSSSASSFCDACADCIVPATTRQFRCRGSVLPNRERALDATHLLIARPQSPPGAPPPPRPSPLGAGSRRPPRRLRAVRGRKRAPTRGCSARRPSPLSLRRTAACQQQRTRTSNVSEPQQHISWISWEVRLYVPQLVSPGRCRDQLAPHLLAPCLRRGCRLQRRAHLRCVLGC